MVDLSNKKILVTGAQGFLGKHLVENLLEEKKVSKEKDRSKHRVDLIRQLQDEP